MSKSLYSEYGVKTGRIIIVFATLFLFNKTVIAENNDKLEPIPIKVGYVEKTDDTVPPELSYTNLSDLMATDFINFYNENDTEKIYGKSDDMLKNKVSYKDFQVAINNLKLMFGDITHFQRITRKEQLSSHLISMLSETKRKAPDGTPCKSYLYRIKCTELPHDGMLELVYTTKNKLVDFYMRSKLDDVISKIDVNSIATNPDGNQTSKKNPSLQKNSTM